MKNYKGEAFIIKAKHNFYITEYKTGECGDGCCSWRDGENRPLEKGELYEITAEKNTYDGYTLEDFLVDKYDMQVIDLPDNLKLVCSLNAESHWCVPYGDRFYVKKKKSKVR